MSKDPGRILIFDTTLNESGPNKIDLNNGKYGFGVDTNTLKYISNEEMKNLNNLYLKKAKSTNVLAFKNEIFLQGEPYQLLGEIALCISVIEKEAKNYQKKFETRFKHMLLHGLLHLLGFDHKIKKWHKIFYLRKCL